MSEHPSDAGLARFPVVLTFVVALALSLLIGLGVWQLQRLKWKEGILAQVAALRTAPAQPLEAVLARARRGADVDFTRVTAECAGLAHARFLELYGLKDGAPGWRLVSACPTPDGPYGGVLVDRGFIADGVTDRPPVDRADETPTPVRGVLHLPSQKSLFSPANTPPHWFTRDIPAMAAALGLADPAPDFLMAETSTNPQLKALDPAPLPTDIPNRHFEYALTWFGLAAGLLGVYGAMLLKRLRGE
jgi:surfeit locus 1 family protein